MFLYLLVCCSPVLYSMCWCTYYSSMFAWLLYVLVCIFGVLYINFHTIEGSCQFAICWGLYTNFTSRRDPVSFPLCIVLGLPVIILKCLDMLHQYMHDLSRISIVHSESFLWLKNKCEIVVFSPNVECFTTLDMRVLFMLQIFVDGGCGWLCENKYFHNALKSLILLLAGKFRMVYISCQVSHLQAHVTMYKMTTKETNRCNISNYTLLAPHSTTASPKNIVRGHDVQKKT